MEITRFFTDLLRMSVEAADVEYIVILNMQGVRMSHPDQSRIGKHFVGG